ncbi:apolipoprotein N-acyltransferase [Thalassiella azotivora]
MTTAPPAPTPRAVTVTSSVAADRARAVALATGGGLLLWWAFPGAGWWWTAPLGVAVVDTALRGRSLRGSAVVGTVAGVAFLLPHLSWAGIYVGWLPLTALVAVQTLFMTAGGVLLRLVQRNPPALALVGTAGAWVAIEAARARVPFGGFGWGRLAFSQADAPTLGLAALGGAPLVTFAVALAGAVLALAVRRTADRRLGAAALATATGVTALLVGLLVPTPVDAQDGTVRVAGVQGNVPRPGLDFNAERRAVLDNHARATEDLADRVGSGGSPRPDLVVWPENASDINPLVNDDARRVIDRAARAVDAPVLVGTLVRDDRDRLQNVTIVWDPQDGPGQRYAKRHPVPFAEYVPYRNFFRSITDLVDLVRADMVPGDRVGTLDVAGTVVGDLICFEVVDDDLTGDVVAAGARLLVVQTNNATFGYTDESVQQLAMSRLRAVEHGRSVAHVSTVGISALVAPDGRVVERSGHFTQEVLEADLPLRSDLTIASRLRDGPETVLVLAGILAAVTGTRRARRDGATQA